MAVNRGRQSLSLIHISTDIQGANNAGLPCCWFNPTNRPRPQELRIDYEIHDLRELLNII